MQISKAISKSGKKIIKAIKKLSPQARLAKKLQYERQTSVRTRKDEKISMSWWSLEKTTKSVDTYDYGYGYGYGYGYDECCTCCCYCCQLDAAVADNDENLRNENLENENLRNENRENEMLRC